MKRVKTPGFNMGKVKADRKQRQERKQKVERMFNDTCDRIERGEVVKLVNLHPAFVAGKTKEEFDTISDVIDQLLDCYSDDSTGPDPSMAIFYAEETDTLIIWQRQTQEQLATAA